MKGKLYARVSSGFYQTLDPPLPLCFVRHIDISLRMRIIHERQTEEMNLREFEITYHSVDPTKPDLGPFTLTAPDLDQAVSLAIQTIKQAHPDIDLQKDYQPLPHAKWREL